MDLVRQTVLEQLTEVAVDVLGVDPSIVSEKSSFKDDLDADSLDLVEVVMALEERFDISVPEEKLDSITTVGEAVDLVMAIASGPETGVADDAATAEAAGTAETAKSAETPEPVDHV